MSEVFHWMNTWMPVCANFVPTENERKSPVRGE